MYRTDFWTLCEKARVGWPERKALKQVYYQGWNRSPAQVGCMRQVLRAGALGRRRGIGWGGRWKGGSGWGTHVNPWLIHVNVWQKPLQYCKVISLQLIKINEKKRSSLNTAGLDSFFFFLFFFAAPWNSRQTGCPEPSLCYCSILPYSWLIAFRLARVPSKVQPAFTVLASPGQEAENRPNLGLWPHACSMWAIWAPANRFQ